jgi:hypothetical protein
MTEPVFKEKGTIPFPEQFKDKFEGWLGEEDEGVFISFIQSKEKGKGNFSKLLRYLKGKYEWIMIPTPSNTMGNICLKKGFKETTEYFPEPFNEWGTILLWQKNPEPEKEAKQK